MAKTEGNKGIKQIMESLNIRTFSKKDWRYSIIGLLLVFAFTGLIFGVSALLNKHFGIRPLSTTPWFMEMHSFQGKEKLLLLIWLPMVNVSFAFWYRFHNHAYSYYYNSSICISQNTKYACRNVYSWDL